jgi:hypothetical protein
VCKDWHNIDEAWPVECHGHFGARVERSGPQIISDTIAPFQSMADGRMYDSKSQYRRTLKDRGLVEVGNDRPTPKRVELPPVRETLRQVKAQMGF